MTPPPPAAFFAALEATWPPAATRRLGPVTLREGAGGGKRVSAATAAAPVTPADLDAAEAALCKMGQAPLFMIRGAAEAELDSALNERGYRIVDPVEIYAAPVADLAAVDPPFMTCFTGAAPLAILTEIWADGGIGPGRLAVMERASPPKCYLFGRAKDRPAGAGFVAVHGSVSMCHALYVPADFRRHSVARNMLRKAAQWAQDHDVEWFSVVTTGENLPARSLFKRLGMVSVGNYHYRMKQTG